MLHKQKVVTWKPNSTVTLTWNLNDSFSTLWIFFGYVSICKEHRSNLFETFSIFHHILSTWNYDITINFRIFRLHMIQPHVPGHGSRKRCSLLPPISWIRPQIGLNNMNMIFRWILLRYSNHLQFKLDLIPTNVFNEIKWLNIENRVKKYQVLI